MSQIDMSKFKRLLERIKKMGFDDMYQAGSPSHVHPLNLILIDTEKDLQIWVTKSFGKFVVIYRDSIRDLRREQYRFPCATQKQVIETIINIRENLCAHAILKKGVNQSNGIRIKAYWEDENV